MFVCCLNCLYSRMTKKALFFISILDKKYLFHNIFQNNLYLLLSGPGEKIPNPYRSRLAKNYCEGISFGPFV